MWYSQSSWCYFHLLGLVLVGIFLPRQCSWGYCKSSCGMSSADKECGKIHLLEPHLHLPTLLVHLSGKGGSVGTKKSFLVIATCFLGPSCLLSDPLRGFGRKRESRKTYRVSFLSSYYSWGSQPNPLDGGVWVAWCIQRDSYLIQTCNEPPALSPLGQRLVNARSRWPSSLGWRHTRSPATVLFLQSWSPNHQLASFLLLSIHLLWSLAPVPEFMVVLNEEEEGKTHWYHLVQTNIFTQTFHNQAFISLFHQYLMDITDLLNLTDSRALI